MAADSQAENGLTRFLIGATHDGRDIAARLSVRLDLRCSQRRGFDASEGGLTPSTRSLAARWCLRAVFHRRRPGIFVIRTNRFAAEPVEAAEPPSP